jgi:hypothetical protein
MLHVKYLVPLFVFLNSLRFVLCRVCLIRDRLPEGPLYFWMFLLCFLSAVDFSIVLPSMYSYVVTQLGFSNVTYGLVFAMHSIAQCARAPSLSPSLSELTHCLPSHLLLFLSVSVVFVDGGRGGGSDGVDSSCMSVRAWVLLLSSGSVLYPSSLRSFSLSVCIVVRAPGSWRRCSLASYRIIAPSKTFCCFAARARWPAICCTVRRPAARGAAGNAGRCWSAVRCAGSDRRMRMSVRPISGAARARVCVCVRAWVGGWVGGWVCACHGRECF